MHSKPLALAQSRGRAPVTSSIIALLWIAILVASPPARADDDLPTKFSNAGGIVNTRHNLTQSGIGAGFVTMNPYRNNYEEVCVYCHTPHGANSGLIEAPLWNRTFTSNTYTTYDMLDTTTLKGEVTQPGMNSLTCLSCHDGTLGIDSIVNMPGSRQYSVASQSAQTNAFLDQWTNTSGADASVHIGLDAVDPASSCLVCHDADAGIVGAGATDFSVFALGTDLTNDHPVGVNVPTALYTIEFNEPVGTKPGILFYDNDSDGAPDANEIRFYNTGDGPEVECGSCHDPHGVSPTGFGGTINSSFLRVPNENSSVCTTCHIK